MGSGKKNVFACVCVCECVCVCDSCKVLSACTLWRFFDHHRARLSQEGSHFACIEHMYEDAMNSTDDFIHSPVMLMDSFLQQYIQ